MKNARAKCAKILFFIVKYANLRGFCCRRRRGCLSSLVSLVKRFALQTKSPYLYSDTVALQTFGLNFNVLFLIDISFLLFISDVTPPSTNNCPVSFTDKADHLQLQKQVTWTPPTFSDNVKVTSVLSNRQPGFTMNAYTSIRIRYTATDAAGNIAYCTFNVTLDGK